ncbi:MAG: HIRAN domain-containing protein [Clostridiales bacterium]|nr:HIRAN domain-containing protein [Clostridiales bacterium]
MSKIYITLTGTKHYYGSEFLKPGMKLKLEKEPDNEYDKEAIMVKLEGMGKIGYVANSPYTVIGESMSAGRLYDKIKEKATVKVVLVTAQGTLCKVNQKNIIDLKNEIVLADPAFTEK